MVAIAPGWFAGLERAASAINRAFAAAASILALVILVVVLIDVTLRLVAEPTVWAHDVARYTLLYLFFFALAPALQSGHHVAVDMFDRLLPAPMRPYQAHSAAVLTAAFGALLLWQLTRLTSQAFADSRLAQATIPLPLRWIYILGPVGTAQFVLTALVQLGRAHWQAASGGEP
ncbi:MAG: TRAP transporter small permease [Betaproteobacteria bacterium]|nr:TRAP transporter small permease [Betaproteobacteria bacterium]